MSKIIQFFIVLLISNLLIVQSVMAKSHLIPGTKEEIELQNEFKLESDFISLMLRTAEQIDNENTDVNIIDNPEKMTLLLQEKMLVYHHFYEDALQIPKEKKESFKKAFLSLNWKKITLLLKKANIGLNVFFKKKGSGFGIAIMAGFLCKFLVPAILVHLSLAHLIPFVVFIPYPFLYSFIPSFLHKIKLRKVLAEELGGKIQVEAFQKQEEILLKALHLSSPEDLIFPIKEVDGMTNAIVIQKETLKSKVLQKMGLDKKALNFGTIKKFIAENTISDSYIDWVVENNNIDKEIKARLLIGHLFNLKNPTIEESFQRQFSENFLLLKKNNNWEEVWNWTQGMLKIKTIDEAFNKIDEAPASIHPKEMSMVWENFLLPEYVKNLDLSYKEARTMFLQFEILKGKLNTTESSVLDEKIKNEIFTYLKKIVMGKSFRGCKNSPAQINEYLLNKLTKVH